MNQLRCINLLEIINPITSQIVVNPIKPKRYDLKPNRYGSNTKKPASNILSTALPNTQQENLDYATNRCDVTQFENCIQRSTDSTLAQESNVKTEHTLFDYAKYRLNESETQKMNNVDDSDDVIFLKEISGTSGCLSEEKVKIILRLKLFT